MSTVYPPFLEGFLFSMFKNASQTPSFIVVVPCYKSSGLILYFFALILKAYTQGVPTRTAAFQDWAYQSFICCLCYLLWISVKNCSLEAKDRISLSAIIAMCIPSQIICDSVQSSFKVYLSIHRFLGPNTIYRISGVLTRKMRSVFKTRKGHRRS